MKKLPQEIIEKISDFEAESELSLPGFALIGSQQAGERAATLMSLIESAKLNGHDAWAYLKDVLIKLPTWPNSRLEELLPHRWVAPTSS